MKAAVKMNGIFLCLIGSLLLVSIACQKKDKAPESALLEFIEYRFSSAQERSKLLEQTVGPIHEQIAGMDDVAFESYAKIGETKKRKVSINFRKCGPEVCQLTYTVAYMAEAEGKEIYKVDTKKIAEMRLVDGLWKIAEVTDLKSYYEGQEILSPPPSAASTK